MFPLFNRLHSPGRPHLLLVPLRTSLPSLAFLAPCQFPLSIKKITVLHRQNRSQLFGEVFVVDVEETAK